MIGISVFRYSTLLGLFLIVSLAELCLAQCNHPFSSQVFQGFEEPQWMGHGDIDKDGDIDILTSRQGIWLTIAINDGNGNLTEVVDLPGGGGIRDVDLHDVDGDSNLDIVAAAEINDSAYILFGNGDGTFDERVDFDGLEKAIEIECLDFNKDGIKDIAVSRLDGVAMIFGEGNRQFSDPSLIEVGDVDRTVIAAGDFNNDGNQDLALTEWGGGAEWFVLLGTGDGNFQAPISFSVPGSSSYWLTPVDVNDDGILDMILSSSNATVWLGLGDGSFELVDVLHNELLALGIAASDFDSDGNVDLAMAIYCSYTILIYSGDGQGSFELAKPMFGPYQSDRPKPWDVVAVDLTGNNQVDVVASFVDGLCAFYDLPADNEEVVDLDFLKSNESLNNGRIADLTNDGVLDFVLLYDTPPHARIFCGTASGGLELKQEIEIEETAFVETVDFNGDSAPDLVVLDENEISVYSGNGDGSFELSQVLAIQFPPRHLTHGDYDGDGDTDIAIAQSNRDVSILWNDGTGEFTIEQAFTSTYNGSIRQILSFDANLDGRTDLLLVQGSSRLWLNQGDGSFEMYFPSLPDAEEMIVQDLNNDQIPDLIALRLFDDEFSALLGDATGSFTEVQTITIPEPISSFYDSFLAYSDFDQDGIGDVVIFQQGDGELFYSPGLGNGVFEMPRQNFLPIPPPNYSRNLFDVSMKDFDADSDLDLVVVKDNGIRIINNLCANNFLIGDVNQDGEVNLLDVDPFVQLIVNGQFQLEADINQDGVVNLLDVNPFVVLLGGG